MGADLAFVFCATEACTPIKSYSPELMVTSFYNGVETAESDNSQNADPVTVIVAASRAGSGSDRMEDSEDVNGDVVEKKVREVLI